MTRNVLTDMNKAGYSGKVDEVQYGSESESPKAETAKRKSSAVPAKYQFAEEHECGIPRGRVCGFTVYRFCLVPKPAQRPSLKRPGDCSSDAYTDSL